jgi:hypothetical protein
MEKLINKKQMQRLQVLYSQLARHTDQGADRESRMRWASELLGRPIESFKALTMNDGRHLIDTLQGQLGVKVPARNRLKGEAAHRAGTDGRRGSPYGDRPQMVSPADLEAITSYYMRLGWTREQFDAWLSSSRSPLSNRAHPTIATLADANRVRWALKGMLQNRGLWEDRVA